MDERRVSVISATQALKWYVVGIVFMAAMTIGGVIGALYVAPDNPVAVPTIIGVTSPIILMLLGLGQRAMAVTQDGKLSRLLRESEDRARAEGLIEGLKENPNVNIE